MLLASFINHFFHNVYFHGLCVLAMKVDIGAFKWQSHSQNKIIIIKRLISNYYTLILRQNSGALKYVALV